MEDLTLQHIANQCSVYLALYGINCEVDCALSMETISCFQKLDELLPHQFAQVFKAAKNKNPDILSFDEAMRDYDNLKDWLAVALKEIKQLEGKGVWTECHKLEACNEQILACTWVSRYKRNPAGEIIKYKARICLRGDLMLDNSDSYAPVVQWSTIQFFIVLAIHMSWITISIDWVNLFPQAILSKPLFMHFSINMD